MIITPRQTEFATAPRILAGQGQNILQQGASEDKGENARPRFYLSPGTSPQMLESVGEVYESRRKHWKFEESQGESTVLQKVPGEKRYILLGAPC